jgi:hypothetical protein
MHIPCTLNITSDGYRMLQSMNAPECRLRILRGMSCYHRFNLLRYASFLMGIGVMKNTSSNNGLNVTLFTAGFRAEVPRPNDEEAISLTPSLDNVLKPV